jgi:DNA modification methylase
VKVSKLKRNPSNPRQISKEKLEKLKASVGGFQKMMENHKACFPVELPMKAIKLSDRTQLVFEPFAGSGTTLVACQNLNRKCYAIEISENYCAVILERMQTAFPDIEIKRIENAATNGV